MRAFSACNLDVASVRRLTEASDALRAHPLAPKARWVPPTKMHVTLKFYGDVDIGLAPALRDGLAPLAPGGRPIHVRFDALSAFPSIDEARVIIALLFDVEGELTRLAAKVEERAVHLGFEPEARPFRPHVTLARPASRLDAGPWLRAVNLPTEPALVTELVLYRSDFSMPRKEYSALARFGMKAG
jgi:2'-5' RNA ligase